MSSVDEEKARLRAAVRARLFQLGAAECARLGSAAAARLATLPEVRTAENLLVFRSLASEVPTDRLLDEALARGQRVFAPRLEPANVALRFVRCAASTHWKPGPFGIPEPEEGEPFGSDDLVRGATVVVVPGLAFSERGDRLGRGGGFYDRALGAPPLAGRVFSVGVALEMQIVPAIPTAGHDARVAAVVTEERTIRPTARSAQPNAS